MNFLRNRGDAGVGRRALASAASALGLASDGAGAPADGGEDEDTSGQPPVEAPAPAEGDQAPAAPAPGEEAAAAPAPAGGEGDDAAAAQPAVTLSARDLEMHAAGRSAMADRIDAVFASEHVAGREQAAAMLLAADVPSDKIIAKLPGLPKGAAGTEMLNNLATEAGNAPAVQPGGGEGEPGTASASKMWDNIVEGMKS